jgi:pimeloyl-ACP methyl ester carboxylesterase
MTKMKIRDVSLHVKVMGHGYPLVLMHGGPGADLHTLMSFRPLADRFTLVFYDHRCNGRSTGAVESMNFENLTADADALRQALGFEKWAVLGHSFGGNVALEYALRYPQGISHLMLVNSGADFRWPREKAPEELAKRGFSPEIVSVARRHFSGHFEPSEMLPNLMKLGKAYNPYTGLSKMPHMLIMGLQTKLRSEALIYAETHFLKDWNVMDRLHEINAPTLVMAGAEDFVYPAEHQKELAAGIPNARLALIERAGHNPHDEQTTEVVKVIRDFFERVERTPA